MLTDRQGECLGLCCAGQAAAEIAEAMGTSLRNVRAMRAAVILRTRAASLDEVCRMVAQNAAPPAIFRNLRGRPR